MIKISPVANRVKIKGNIKTVITVRYFGYTNIDMENLILIISRMVIKVHIHKVVFLTEAGEEIGMGHVMECLTIADYIRKHSTKCKIHFLINDFGPARNIISQRGYKYTLEVEDGSSAQLESFKDWVCICSLKDKTKEEYAEIRAIMDYFVVIVDTSSKEETKAIPADLVINFNIVHYPDEFGRRYLIGPEYAPISDELVVADKTVREQCKNILVALGGTDPFKNTEKIIGILNQLPLDDKRIFVVIGGGVTVARVNAISKMVMGSKNDYCLVYDIPYQEMIDTMKAADIAITTPGNTLYELACLGVPSIVVSNHEEHLAVAHMFQCQDAAVSVGIGEELNEDKMVHWINGFLNHEFARQEFSNNMKAIVDGKGCERIWGAICQIYF